MISTGTASNAARPALDVTHDDLLAAAKQLYLLYESAQWYTVEVASAILNRGTPVAEMTVADLLTIVRQTSRELGLPVTEVAL
jgi:hypothetical protein